MHRFSPFRFKLAHTLQLALVPFLLAACGGSDAEPPQAVTPTTPQATLTVAGDAATGGTLTTAQLKALPSTTSTDSFGSGSGPQTHTYTGTSVWGALNQIGIKTDPNVKNDLLNKIVVATGTDGYRAVFALGELSPDFGNRASRVVYAETINGVSGALPAADGPLRVTAPGDTKGGRYISNLVRLDIRSSGSTVAGTGGGASTQFKVSGAVQRPGTFGLTALQNLPVVTRTVSGITYTGVSLWDLLNTTVGVVNNPAVKNDSLAKYVVATGSDGYKAVVSFGEMDPNFGNQPDFIAYAANGVPLTTNGFARLVLPNDGKQGRFVSSLISLEVIAAPVGQ